jgi:hypothetical protein
MKLLCYEILTLVTAAIFRKSLLSLFLKALPCYCVSARDKKHRSKRQAASIKERQVYITFCMSLTGTISIFVFILKIIRSL